MKPIEQQRAEFEAWAKNNLLSLARSRDRTELYDGLLTRGAWLAWQEQERRHETIARELVDAATEVTDCLVVAVRENVTIANFDPESHVSVRRARAAIASVDAVEQVEP